MRERYYLPPSREAVAAFVHSGSAVRFIGGDQPDFFAILTTVTVGEAHNRDHATVEGVADTGRTFTAEIYYSDHSDESSVRVSWHDEQEQTSPPDPGELPAGPAVAELGSGEAAA